MRFLLTRRDEKVGESVPMRDERVVTNAVIDEGR